MPISEDSPSRPATTTCRRCGAATANPFAGAGRVCLRCAGERALALGSDSPFESLTPAADSEEPAPPPQRATVRPGDSDLPACVGPYEIIEELGRGGMGRVFAARQRGLGRIVALKVLALGPGAPMELEMRFLREAQTVARLRNPHIVAIHDSGRAAGQIYFSMDYIEGGDLARRLRERPFTPREAAELVAKVATALAFAHAEGVLHRDIKPSNILLDGDEPRLADFGLATHVETSGDLTSASGVFGTPHYLAPEAVRGGGAALSAASDLYALGIVFYVLLTGRTPFAGASPANLPALINETDPPAIRLLAPAVPPELETICLKCVERDPLRRYAGAAALAEDLRRFLAGEPILARPPGRVERFRRFARRHQAALLSASVAFAVLVTATVVSTSLAVRASRAEKRAAIEAAAARAVSEFLQNDLLAQASPDSQPDRDLKLRTVLDRAEKKIDGRFTNQPLVEASIRETLATTYAALGDHVAEERHLTRALALLLPALGERDPRGLRDQSQLATALAFQSKIEAAIRLSERSLALTNEVLGPDHPQTVRAMLNTIYVFKAGGRLPAAEELAIRARATAMRVLGPDHNHTCDAIVYLSSVYWAERKLPEAEAVGVEGVAAKRRVLGPEHPDTLNAMHNLASVYWSAGKLAQSEQLGLETLALRQRVLGPEHTETLRTMNNLATTYNDQGKFAEAITLHEQTLAIRRRDLGPEHIDTVSTTMNLSMVHLRQGDLATTESLLVPALEVCRRVLGPSHTHTLTALANLGDVRRRQGRLAEAEALVRESYGTRAKLYGPDSPQALLGEDALAAILLEANRPAEAEPLLRHSLALREKSAAHHWRTATVRYRLGAALAAQNRRAEAEPLLVSGIEELQSPSAELPAAQRFILADALKKTAALYADWGQPADAQRWRGKLDAFGPP